MADAIRGKIAGCINTPAQNADARLFTLVSIAPQWLKNGEMVDYTDRQLALWSEDDECPLTIKLYDNQQLDLECLSLEDYGITYFLTSDGEEIGVDLELGLTIDGGLIGAVHLNL